MLMVLITFVVVKVITMLTITLLLSRLKRILVTLVVVEVHRMTMSLRIILRVAIYLKHSQLE